MNTASLMVKNAGANLIHGLSLDTLLSASRGQSSAPLVLCYHRVVQDFSDAASRSMPSLLVSTAMFEKQLDWLARHFDMVALEDITGNCRQTHDRHHKRMAAITFDDGYADFYWNAAPVMKRKGIPSAVFVVSDLVGTDQLQTHDELYLIMQALLDKDQQQQLLPRLSFMTIRLANILADNHSALDATRAVLSQFSPDEIKQLLTLLRDKVNIPPATRLELKSLNWSMCRSLASQGVTIGSHTRSHSLLPLQTDRDVESQLVDSRLRLQQELGRPSNYLAYPDGQFDERIASAAKSAGYNHAYTICNHHSSRNPELTLSRRVLWQNSCTDQHGRFSPALLSCLVNGVFDFRQSCSHEHSEK